MADKQIAAEENIGLVHSCAKRFKGRGIEYEELFQAGCLGLVKAADNFDSTLGFQFSTYAVPVIIGEIKKLFRDGGALKISRSLKELSLKVNRESESFMSEHGREPTLSELSEILGLPAEEIAEAINAGTPPISLTVSNDEGEMQTDIPVDSPDECITDRLSLQSELNRLEKTDRDLIELRFYRGLTQSQTGKQLGMTQVQVSRKEKNILLTLRKRLQ